jgi:hypothetical protein
MDFLKNFAVNIRAAGPAAVMIGWFASITAVAIFADSENAQRATQYLFFAGCIILPLYFMRPPGGRS